MMDTRERLANEYAIAVWAAAIVAAVVAANPNATAQDVLHRFDRMADRAATERDRWDATHRP